MSSTTRTPNYEVGAVGMGLIVGAALGTIAATLFASDIGIGAAIGAGLGLTFGTIIAAIKFDIETRAA